MDNNTFDLKSTLCSLLYDIVYNEHINMGHIFVKIFEQLVQLNSVNATNTQSANTISANTQSTNTISANTFIDVEHIKSIIEHKFIMYTISGKQVVRLNYIPVVAKYANNNTPDVEQFNNELYNWYKSNYQNDNNTCSKKKYKITNSEIQYENNKFYFSIINDIYMHVFEPLYNWLVSQDIKYDAGIVNAHAYKYGMPLNIKFYLTGEFKQLYSADKTIIAKLQHKGSYYVLGKYLFNNVADDFVISMIRDNYYEIYFDACSNLLINMITGKFITDALPVGPEFWANLDQIFTPEFITHTRSNYIKLINSADRQLTLEGGGVFQNIFEKFATTVADHNRKINDDSFNETDAPYNKLKEYFDKYFTYDKAAQLYLSDLLKTSK